MSPERFCTLRDLVTTSDGGVVCLNCNHVIAGPLAFEAQPTTDEDRSRNEARFVVEQTIYPHDLPSS